MEQGEIQFESEQEESDEGETWEKPSAYSQLVGSLQKTSKNRVFYDRIKREQEGIEDDESDSEEEENDMMEDQEEGSDEEIDDEDVEEESVDGEAEEAEGMCGVILGFIPSC